MLSVSAQKGILQELVDQRNAEDEHAEVAEGPTDIEARFDQAMHDICDRIKRGCATRSRGRVPYLEKVINCNLRRLSRLLRILRFHTHDLKLVPFITVYMRWGKGPKRRLRFTKTGDPRIEEAYSRHFVWPGKRPFFDGASESRHPG